MTPRLRDERGFVLSMVIFAVAALSVAGTALFLVVQSESAMANAGAESTAALHLANAGLARYMGESFGEPDSQVVYQMGGGTVTVTASKVLSLGDTADLYIVHSEAEIRDRRANGIYSRRAVQQYGRYRKRPFNPVAALTVATADVRSNTSVVLDGNDACGAGDAVAGIATTGARDADLRGSISTHQAYASREEMLAAIDADWEVLTDPSLPVDYQDEWPGFGAFAALPADSFPVIRFDGDVTVNWWTPPGRGLLIVDGKLTLNNTMFAWEWDGVILAGSIEIRNNARADIDGAVLTGFEDGQGSLSSAGLKNVRVGYDSCDVIGAAQGISMFSPVPNTWWEVAD